MSGDFDEDQKSINDYPGTKKSKKHLTRQQVLIVFLQFYWFFEIPKILRFNFASFLARTLTRPL